MTSHTYVHTHTYAHTSHLLTHTHTCSDTHTHTHRHTHTHIHRHTHTLGMQLNLLERTHYIMTWHRDIIRAKSNRQQPSTALCTPTPPPSPPRCLLLPTAYWEWWPSDGGSPPLCPPAGIQLKAFHLPIIISASQQWVSPHPLYSRYNNTSALHKPGRASVHTCMHTETQTHTPPLLWLIINKPQEWEEGGGGGGNPPFHQKNPFVILLQLSAACSPACLWSGIIIG